MVIFPVLFSLAPACIDYSFGGKGDLLGGEDTGSTASETVGWPEDSECNIELPSPHEVGVTDGCSYEVGEFNPVAEWNAGSGLYSWAAPAVADLDGDDLLDILVPNVGMDELFLNTGNDTWVLAGDHLPDNTAPTEAASAVDVDDDGDLDAFVANRGQPNKIWINDGNGNFTDSGQSLGSSSGVSLDDVDGDGDLDAFVTNGDNQGNKVWLNVGNGIGAVTLNQATTGAYTLTYDGANTFSLSRDGGTAVDYVLTTDPASTGSPETATFNLDGNDITIELKQGYAQLDGSDFTFNVQNTTTYNANVLSVDDARTAITAIDHAIDEVNRERSYIGSEQNKLQFTMSNLSNNIQNIEASRSTIEDADFAAEAADLAKNQILAQSATAMLAQASAISQNVLGLLS